MTPYLVGDSVDDVLDLVDHFIVCVADDSQEGEPGRLAALFPLELLDSEYDVGELEGVREGFEGAADLLNVVDRDAQL